MKRHKVSFHHYPLHFKFEAKTSRNVLRIKDSWIVEIEDEIGNKGYGECGPIWGLSPETEKDLSQAMAEMTDKFDLKQSIPESLPSLKFGIEIALKNILAQSWKLFETSFSRGETGIPINGLIWMGDIDFMKRQIASKLEAGFSCLKLKIGTQNHELEVALLGQIREQFSPMELEIRLDANGAYTPKNALQVLNSFSKFHIHSLEQPIQPGQWAEMSAICKNSPIPIALDEELIGIYALQSRQDLLAEIKPSYIILKPSLLGGLSECDQWISIAEKMQIQWWATSMLESDIGLNAIAQWVSTKGNTMKQGLGTGQLYSNNIVSPLRIQGEELWLSERDWGIEHAIQSTQ